MHWKIQLHAAVAADLDDVEPGRPVRRSWQALAREAEGALWLGKYGLLCLGPEGSTPG